MIHYRIRLKDGEDVPIGAGQSVKDWGVGLAIVESCTCQCGDRHEKMLRFIQRTEIAEAVVTGDGMSMRI